MQTLRCAYITPLACVDLSAQLSAIDRMAQHFDQREFVAPMWISGDEFRT